MSIEIALALGQAKKFNPSRSVKHSIASCFNTDANLFIEKYDCLIRHTDSMQNRNFRSKAIIDLLMSIECSLKSMIISLSKDSEEPSNSYLKARKKGHNIVDLFDECSKRSKNKLRFMKKPNIFVDVSRLGVDKRYSFEIWTLRLKSAEIDLFFGNDLVSKTIDNPIWAKDLRKLAIQLLKLSSKAIKKYLDPHSVLIGKKFSQRDNKLNKFLLGVKK